MSDKLVTKPKPKNMRRSDYDVTNNVNVTSAESVCLSVREIFDSLFGPGKFSAIEKGFEDFDKLFEGEFDGYQACDTFYHDKQHTLDMTLALARLIEGYQQLHSKQDQLSLEFARIGLICALYHDSGYIRQTDDSACNGSVYTKTHVSRSAIFLARYLPMIGLEDYVDIARNIVHYTGYEIKPTDIVLHDKKLHTIGYMLGSADLIAQMSDRCYLEKCRDRLYPEFVLGEVAEMPQDDGSTRLLYTSGNHLLEKTPGFYQHEINGRLNHLFNGVYQYAKQHFGDSNHYIDALEANMSHLDSLISENNLHTLSRIPLVNNGTLFVNTANSEAIKRLKIK
ncbi:MAG: hypothetical protein OEY36_12375 [Gammaproteobacteria bacterium]|nr:hypothetical protein [Gammaproteobacteria bacterium]